MNLDEAYERLSKLLSTATLQEYLAYKLGMSAEEVQTSFTQDIKHLVQRLKMKQAIETGYESEHEFESLLLKDLLAFAEKKLNCIKNNILTASELQAIQKRSKMTPDALSSLLTESAKQIEMKLQAYDELKKSVIEW